MIIRKPEASRLMVFGDVVIMSKNPVRPGSVIDLYIRNFKGKKRLFATAFVEFCIPNNELDMIKLLPLSAYYTLKQWKKAMFKYYSILPSFLIKLRLKELLNPALLKPAPPFTPSSQS